MELIAFIKSNKRYLSAGVLITFASCFGQTFFISIFAAHIMSDYGLTDGQWGAIYGLGTLASGLTMIWVGGLSDVFRTRALALVVHLSICAFCLAMAVNQSVWLLPVIIFGLRITGQGLGSHIANVAMARWYVAARGKAISIAALGFSVGEAILPMIFAALLTSFHWRVLWLVPVLMMAVLIPVVQNLLKAERAPQSIPDDEQTIGMDGHHWTRNQAIRSLAFWGILPVFLMPNAFGTALFFQQVHLAQYKGWDHAGFVALFPLYTGVSVISAILFGMIIDRIGSIQVIRVLLLPMVLSFLIFSQASTLGMAAVAFVLLGVMQGGAGTCSTAFWSEAFGTKYIGSIKAAAAALMVIASALGPVITGYFIDLGISFSDQMPWIAAFIFGVSILASLASRPISKRLPNTA